LTLIPALLDCQVPSDPPKNNTKTQLSFLLILTLAEALVAEKPFVAVAVEAVVVVEVVVAVEVVVVVVAVAVVVVVLIREAGMETETFPAFPGTFPEKAAFPEAVPAFPEKAAFLEAFQAFLEAFQAFLEAFQAFRAFRAAAACLRN
jgi:hypothetical protein